MQSPKRFMENLIPSSFFSFFDFFHYRMVLKVAVSIILLKYDVK